MGDPSRPPLGDRHHAPTPERSSGPSASSSAVARAILAAGALTYRAHDPVTFRSGLCAPVYIDCRRLISRPSAWRAVVEALAERLDGDRGGIDVLAGVEAAGIPHSSALAYAVGLPCVYVRKAPKGHGLGRRVEGGDVAGARVLLIEDLVTTGGSSLSAIAALREAGATPAGCLAIASYGLATADEAFRVADVGLEVLTTAGSIVAEALAAGLLRPDQAAVVEAWLSDPDGWRPETVAAEG